MKKTIAALLIGSAAGILFAGYMDLHHFPSHRYPQTFRVYSVDPAADIVTLETSTGYLFDLEGVEDWQPGDTCSAIMDSKGTVDITDDEIITTRYSGF